MTPPLARRALTPIERALVAALTSAIVKELRAAETAGQSVPAPHDAAAAAPTHEMRTA